MRNDVPRAWGPNYERDCVRDIEGGVPNCPGGSWRLKQQRESSDEIQDQESRGENPQGAALARGRQAAKAHGEVS